MKEERKFLFFLCRGDIQGTNLLIDGLKYRLNLVLPYAHNWDQVIKIWIWNKWLHRYESVSSDRIHNQTIYSCL